MYALIKDNALLGLFHTLEYANMAKGTDMQLMCVSLPDKLQDEVKWTIAHLYEVSTQFNQRTNKHLDVNQYVLSRSYT
jgi:hypothetical protein